MPAPFRVIWTLRAERDLAGIRDYVATESPTAADRLADRLFQAGQRLSDFPDVGRPEGVTRVLTTVPPYLIRYRVQREGVVIVGVRHGDCKRPVDRKREKVFPMDEAEKAMFAKSVDSVKGLVEACKGIDESLKR